MHVQLADRIREAIDAGELKPRDPIPSPRELADKAGLDLPVVHKAIRRLQASHYLCVISGRSFVTSRH